MPSRSSRTLLTIMPLAASLVLAACGGGDGAAPSAPAAMISGTAAVGHPLVGATVAFKCVGGSLPSVTTSSTGGYTVSIGAATLPCAVHVSGGTAGVGGAANTQDLYSLAAGSGTAHVTPLTTLVLARAIQMSGATAADLASWYAGSIGATLSTIATNHLADAVGVLHSLMSSGSSGYSWPTASGFNPLTSTFSPNPGDAYDDLLEALQEALADAGLSLEDLATDFLTVAGSLSLPVVPDDEPGEPGETDCGAPVCYGGTAYTPQVNLGVPNVTYGTESGSWDVTARQLNGGLGFVEVRIGTDSPVAGNYAVDTVNAASGSVIAAGKAQIYTWGTDDGMAWTDETSTGQVTVAVSGSRVTVSSTGITLSNGKTVAFTLVAQKPAEAGTPVGKARSFSFTDDAAAARAEMVGEYDVAIYAAPSASETGQGKLVVAYSGGTLSLTLKNAAGTELIMRSGKEGSDYTQGTLTTEDGFAADPAGVYAWNTTPGRRTGVYNYFQGGNSTGPAAYFAVNFFSNGVIAGNTAGYYFRNDVTAYGPAIPAIFTSLAGSYAGPAQQQLCNPNPISVNITAEGRIITQGKTSVSCTVTGANEAWDGQQDLLVPDVGGGSKLILNALNSGGSQPGGGYFITLDSSVPPQITQLFLPFAGADGDITSVALVKQ